jgi:hypothetical protein
MCAAVVVCEDRPLMPFRACTVTFRDHDGVLQTAKVNAETAFEAAALAFPHQTPPSSLTTATIGDQNLVPNEANA